MRKIILWTPVIGFLYLIIDSFLLNYKYVRYSDLPRGPWGSFLYTQYHVVATGMPICLLIIKIAT